MADDWLKERLVRADEAMTPQVSGAREIVQAVKRRRAVQRSVRAAASIAGVGVIAVLSIVLTLSRSADRATPVADAGRGTIPENVNRTHGQDARVTGSDVAIQVDRQLHEATAEALWLKQRARRAAARTDSYSDPLADVRFQRDRAAMTLVYQAERFARDAHQSDRAIAQYRKVIDLFPHSAWADVARQRLREIQARSEV